MFAGPFNRKLPTAAGIEESELRGRPTFCVEVIKRKEAYLVYWDSLYCLVKVAELANYKAISCKCLLDSNLGTRVDVTLLRCAIIKSDRFQGAM